jgi:hypothetical protein
MSNTIAHRPHVHHHVPVMPVLAVVLAIVIAAAVIWAINQPQTINISTTSPGTVALPVVQPNEVPVPRSEVVRHAQMIPLLHGQAAQSVLARRLHFIEGTTLTPLSTAPYAMGPVWEGRARSLHRP